jgi:hypothetical protein
MHTGHQARAYLLVYFSEVVAYLLIAFDPPPGVREAPPN